MVRPMLRAVPSMVLMADSRFVVFRSWSLSLAISSIFSRRGGGGGWVWSFLLSIFAMSISIMLVVLPGCALSSFRAVAVERPALFLIVHASPPPAARQD